MKDFRGMKRNRGRNRKPAGAPSNNPNRAYESNGPEGAKVRGNAQTIYEKYQQLARDANSSGDRVLAENYLQHAEHYFRIIRLTQPQRPVSEFVQRDPFMTGFDMDYDDEADQPEAEAQEAEALPQDQDDTRYEPRRDRQDDRQSDRMSDRQPDRGFERQPRPRDGARDSEGLDNQGRRESRRERFERRRQQRLQDQQFDPAVLGQPHPGNGSGNGYAPQTNGFGQPVPPIASTEPVSLTQGYAPSRFDQPLTTPLIAPVEPVRRRPPPVADTTDHLPAFLKAAAPVVAEAPEASLPEDEAPVRKPRRRKIADQAASEEA